jgi:hypothetical protein
MVDEIVEIAVGVSEFSMCDFLNVSAQLVRSFQGDSEEEQGWDEYVGVGVGVDVGVDEVGLDEVGVGVGVGVDEVGVDEVGVGVGVDVGVDEGSEVVGSPDSDLEEEASESEGAGVRICRSMVDEIVEIAVGVSDF